MIPELPVLAVCCSLAFCGALIGCSALRSFSLRRNLLDQPNDRSLHTVPVPRLGGVAIASATWLALLAFHVISANPPGRFEWAWLIISIPIATIGMVDDLRPLKAGTRLLVQFTCAATFCLLAGIPRGVSLIAPAVHALPPALSLMLWSFFIVAVLNIFNFMDGMDGLAGTQSLGAALGVGGAFGVYHHPTLVTLCALIGAASAGFLFQNFPPAKIFMGDAGSTFLGFSFAALAVIGADLEPAVPAPVFGVALAPFLLDGTTTLLGRALQGKPVWKAHRSHVYQRAVTAGRTHHAVLGVYALWIGACAPAAVWATQASGTWLAAVLVGVLLTFCAILAWVRGLERSSAQSSLDSRIHATSSATAAVKST